jgi:hypothetical protein
LYPAAGDTLVCLADEDGDEFADRSKLLHSPKLVSDPRFAMAAARARTARRWWCCSTRSCEACLTVTFRDPRFGEMVRAAQPVTLAETPAGSIPVRAR